jgi:hypothetical protein
MSSHRMVVIDGIRCRAPTNVDGSRTHIRIDWPEGHEILITREVACQLRDWLIEVLGIPVQLLDQNVQGGKAINCTHPEDSQMYRQLNKSRELAVTVADLCGGINPYIWREEYCGECGEILRTLGDKPSAPRKGSRAINLEQADRPGTSQSGDDESKRPIVDVRRMQQLVEAIYSDGWYTQAEEFQKLLDAYLELRSSAYAELSILLKNKDHIGLDNL